VSAWPESIIFISHSASRPGELLFHSLSVTSPESQQIEISANVEPVKTLRPGLSQYLLRIVQAVQRNVLKGEVAVSRRRWREPQRLLRLDHRFVVLSKLLVDDTEI
jgi:hypothetical protein